jgi:hypothetical protein
MFLFFLLLASVCCFDLALGWNANLIEQKKKTQHWIDKWLPFNIYVCTCSCNTYKRKVFSKCVYCWCCALIAQVCEKCVCWYFTFFLHDKIWNTYQEICIFIYIYVMVRSLKRNAINSNLYDGSFEGTYIGWEKSTA